MHLFLFSREMGKENVAVHKKCFQGKNNVIFCWLVGDLFGIWLVSEWFGLFVGGWTGLWVACGWFGWCKNWQLRHGVKVGPGPRDLPQSLKVGPGTPLKFKSGTPVPPSKFQSRIPGSPSKFKSGTPSPFFNEFMFFRIFNRFLSLCLF